MLDKHWLSHAEDQQKETREGLPVSHALGRPRCSRLECHPCPWVVSTLQKTQWHTQQFVRHAHARGSYFSRGSFLSNWSSCVVAGGADCDSRRPAAEHGGPGAGCSPGQAAPADSRPCPHQVSPHPSIHVNATLAHPVSHSLAALQMYGCGVSGKNINYNKNEKCLA